jgi:hypothetical protein
MSETDVLACTINRAPSIAVGVTSWTRPGFFEEAMVGSSWITAILVEPQIQPHFLPEGVLSMAPILVSWLM